MKDKKDFIELENESAYRQAFNVPVEKQGNEILHAGTGRPLAYVEQRGETSGLTITEEGRSFVDPKRANW
jgi:hypothetical protein